jgi:hypothetical protein
MAAVAVRCCCLCRANQIDKRRRRKLHGGSCATLKEQLQSFSSVPLESLAETKDEDAYLCSSCETQLKSIGSLETKLTEMKSKVKEKLSNLHSVLGTPMDALRKRLLAFEGTDHSQPTQKKRAVSSQDEPTPVPVLPGTPARPRPPAARVQNVQDQRPEPGSSPAVQV